MLVSIPPLSLLSCSWALEGSEGYGSLLSGDEEALGRDFVPKANDSISSGRPSDSAGAGLRHPQEFHRLPGAADGSRHAQGRQGASVMGLEDRKEERLD